MPPEPMQSPVCPPHPLHALHHHECHPGHGVHFGRRVLATLVGILLAYSIIFVGTLIRNNLQKFYYIGRAERSERTIRVAAEGKVTATPDIAVTTMGMIMEEPTVAEAQAKNTEVMNTLIARLKELGINEKDIQTTNYNIYPAYTYREDGDRELRGYEVSQNVTVKIRDLTKASQVIALAGEVGANTVSGLSFTFDDPEVYRAEARKLALEKIRVKAEELEKELVVNFVRVYSYDESEGGSLIPMYAAKEFGYGGADAAPDILAGSSDVIMTVAVTLEME